MKIVELITFGDELLDGRRIDTNTGWLGRRFSAMGFPPRYRQTTTDRLDDIVDAFRMALSRADLILTTGGLGPTADDLTFEGLAKALNEPLVFHDSIFEKIKERFASKGLVCPDSNRRQAMLPQSARELSNPWGTAPGVVVEKNGKIIFCLPGVPDEMKNIFDDSIVPMLDQKYFSEQKRREKIYTFVGIGESMLETHIDRCKLGEIQGGEVRIAYTASFPQVDVTLSVLPDANQDAVHLQRQAHDRILVELGKYLVTEDGEKIEEKVIAEFRKRNWTLSLAESFTGGLLASKLIEVPGSSDVVDQGWITYSNRSKVDQLAVASTTLDSFGSVSKECAIEMALGAKARSGATIAVSTTGIAGPAGATDTKPVGLAFMAFAGPGIEDKSGVVVQQYQFRWDRNRNRLIAVYEALKVLLQMTNRH